MNHRYIIIFDGLCKFCNGAVNFIIKRDSCGYFFFSPMQSEFAQHLVTKYQGVSVAELGTLLLIKNGKCYERTDAVLEIARDLSGFWYLSCVLKIVPHRVRDYFYKLLASNRYYLFGKFDSCLVPDEDICNRFIE